MKKEIPNIPSTIPIMVLANHRDMGHHRCVTDEEVQFFIESLERYASISLSLKWFLLMMYFLNTFYLLITSGLLLPIIMINSNSNFNYLFTIYYVLILNATFCYHNLQL